MFLTIVCFSIFIGLYFLLKDKKQIMLHGKHTRSKEFVINNQAYYLEEVRFKTYQEALTNYFKIVEDIAHSSEILETKYDLYDWTFSYIRFKDMTVSLKHFRNYKTVQLAMSKTPISLDKIELDNPAFKYKK